MWEGIEEKGKKQNPANIGVFPGKEYTQYSLHNIHLQYPWVMELTRHPQVLRVVSAILGPDVILLDTRFICKYPTISPGGTDGKDALPYVAWHQDMRWRVV